MGEEKILRCLSNSISRFIHLVSSSSLKNMPCQKDYKEVAQSLKLFKPLLDNVAGDRVHTDEILCKDSEELDVAVNEAREFIENWGAHMSNIYSVVQSRQLILKIHRFSVQICQTVSRSLGSSSTSTSDEIQHCIQELQNLKLEIVSERIEEALTCLRDGLVPSLELLTEIIELLFLTSSQELLKESIDVEKENRKVNKSDQIIHIANLVWHIRETMVKLESFKVIKGVPIPSYFRCPLSLELMADPVIVATGQTYERDSIKEWLNHGLTTCPVTRQKLSHTKLIPNYTVKALIVNWCEEHNIEVKRISRHDPEESEDSASNDLIYMGNSFDPSLQNNHSTSRSTLEVGNGFERQSFDKSDHSSPRESYSHSRRESTSTAVSSSDYQQTVSSYKHEILNKLSGELTSDCRISSPLNETTLFSPWLSGKQYHSSNDMDGIAANSESCSYPRSVSLPSDSSNDLTTTSHVEKLVNDLKSLSDEVQTAAAAELRFLAKHNMENRIIIANCGAIQPLLSLLHNKVKLTQEHAVTTLLNLSINGNIKSMIAEAGAVEPLIHVLNTGNTCAKENAAATLFSLSVLEEYRVKIGQSAAVKALVDLLGSGTLRGLKDAATALFNLSIFHDNKPRIIQAGAVKYLVELLDPPTEMVDKAVALLSNLSTVAEGCLAIAREGGIPSLVEIVDTGSQRGKENAASILLQLCLSSPKYCRLVLQEGAVPPLVALSQSGTPRAREKAQQLLSHFRNLRESATGREKS